MTFRKLEARGTCRISGQHFKVANGQQIDFHVGFGLAAAAVDHIVGVGYSFRFQAIRSKE